MISISMKCTLLSSSFVLVCFQMKLCPISIGEVSDNIGNRLRPCVTIFVNLPNQWSDNRTLFTLHLVDRAEVREEPGVVAFSPSGSPFSFVSATLNTVSSWRDCAPLSPFLIYIVSLTTSFSFCLPLLRAIINTSDFSHGRSVHF